MPVAWDCVSVAPVRTPDGHVTVPEEVIHSMQKNKIGLKGVFDACLHLGKQGILCRTFGDTSGERCSVSQLDSEKVYNIAAFLDIYIQFSDTQSVQSVCKCATMCVTGRLQDRL